MVSDFQVFDAMANRLNLDHKKRGYHSLHDGPKRDVDLHAVAKRERSSS